MVELSLSAHTVRNRLLITASTILLAANSQRMLYLPGPGYYRGTDGNGQKRNLKSIFSRLVKDREVRFLALFGRMLVTSFPGWIYINR